MHDQKHLIFESTQSFVPDSVFIKGPRDIIDEKLWSTPDY